MPETDATLPAPESPTDEFDGYAFRTTDAQALAIEDIRGALVIREDGMFLLMDTSGAVPAGNSSGYGLYYQDTRFLSQYEFSFSRTAPVMLLSLAERGYLAEQVLTNPTMESVDGVALTRETIEVRRVRVVRDVLEETLTVTNFNARTVTLDFVYRFAADFADIFEVRGHERAAHGRHHRPRIEQGTIIFSYTGVDEVRRETRISFSQPPRHLTGRHAVFRLELPHRQPVTVTLTIAPSALSERPVQRNRVHDLVAEYRGWKEQGTRIVTSNELFNAVLDRSTSDLRMLSTTLDDMPVPFIAAGTPWYDTLFGRDSLISAFQTLAFNPDIARASLDLLGRMQGVERDERRDEEPGKILHELRRGEMARTGEIPFSRYYGSIDSTPLYLMLAAEYWRWTGDRAFLRRLGPVLEAGLTWLKTFGDRDGDGYLEYYREGEGGLINQGWKDSGDAIRDGEGRLARPPIALVEVQAYAYAAKLGLARLAADHDDPSRAARLRAEAEALRRQFNRDFWMAKGTYALALDADKRQADSVSSNPGHALWAGIVPLSRARRVADRLMQPDVFTGWGVRTLADSEPAFNPLGYHIGSVWPHDNALLAMGLKRYGLEVELNQIATALFEAAQQFDYFRLPELFCGMQRNAQGAPVPYPVACRPQAWAAGALPMILMAILGLCPDAPRGQLFIVRPHLPPWLSQVRVRGLRVGGATVDLLYELRERRTYVSVLNATNRLHVTMADRWPEE